MVVDIVRITTPQNSVPVTWTNSECSALLNKASNSPYQHFQLSRCHLYLLTMSLYSGTLSPELQMVHQPQRILWSLLSWAVRYHSVYSWAWRGYTGCVQSSWIASIEEHVPALENHPLPVPVSKYVLRIKLNIKLTRIRCSWCSSTCWSAYWWCVSRFYEMRG